MFCLSSAGTPARILGLHVENERTHVFYNLTIEQFHTYFVGIGSPMLFIAIGAGAVLRRQCLPIPD